MKYKGSWLKGFAGAFDPVGGINLGLQWKERRAAQKKIDDAVEQLKLNVTTLAGKYDADRADGSITQQEYSDAIAWALPLGDEIMGRVEKLYSGYRQFTKEQIDSELGEINAFYNLSADLDFSNIEEMKAFRNNLTQEKAKIKWDLIIKSIEGRQIQPTLEVFPTAEGVKEKYPDAGVRFTDRGYVPTFKEITEPEAPGITDYNSAVNYLLKFKDSPPDTFNRIKAGFQSQFPNIDMSAITQESLREPAPEPKTRATSLPLQEDYKQKALDANTWTDAQATIKTYTEAGYDPSEMPVKQDWINAKLEELDSHVEMLGEITDEEGRLMGGKEFKFMSGDKAESKTGSEWYKDIYEAYMFYLEELRKMGIDVSKYRKIKSPGEVSKVGFLKGMVTPGVERGYPSIYY